ncbi:MAG: hypothetical protein ACYDCK_04465 [Thermoplasmatota archaeon]
MKLAAIVLVAVLLAVPLGSAASENLAARDLAALERLVAGHDLATRVTVALDGRTVTMSASDALVLAAERAAARGIDLARASAAGAPVTLGAGTVFAIMYSGTCLVRASSVGPFVVAMQGDISWGASLPTATTGTASQAEIAGYGYAAGFFGICIAIAVAGAGVFVP